MIHTPEPVGAEIHVWNVDPTTVASLQGLAIEWLSDEERAEAARFRMPQRGQAFAAHRASLRLVLASYLRCAPRAVPLTRGETGKMNWSASSPHQSLAFNIAHRGSRALIAVTSLAQIGVDLEFADLAMKIGPLALQTFSPRELRAFQTLHRDQQAAALLRAWTSKEAFLKAIGVGLARPLSSVEVNCLRQQEPQLLATGDPSDDPARWLLMRCDEPPHWFAAVAVPHDAEPSTLQRFDGGQLWEEFRASPVGNSFSS